MKMTNEASLNSLRDNIPVITRISIGVILIVVPVLILTSCQRKEDRHGDRIISTRPNIIFLLTDDQRVNSLGSTGHPFVRTPNLDLLAKEGVRFTNTYIAEPICIPSRVSLFTGMHERKHGIGFSSSYQLSEEQWEQTYPALLRQHGYYTGFIGKFGVEYYSFFGNADEKFDFWRGHDGWTRFFPKDFNINSCIPYHDAKQDIITYIMGESIELFFDSIANITKPFCLSVSFSIPHASQTTSMYAHYRDWRKMTRPANENPKLAGHPYYDTLYRNLSFAIPEDCCSDPYQFIPKRIMDQDQERSRMYSFNYNPETCREHHIRYHQDISAMDHIIGEMRKSMKERDLADNTILIFSSDHGLLMGEYGMGGKALLYDLVSKIPCIVYDPTFSRKMGGKEMDQLVSSLDITSTILDYAGVDQPEIMDGQSLIPLMQGNETGWRDELFLESLYSRFTNPFCEGIRMGKWKYVRMYLAVDPYSEADLNFRGRNPDFEQLFNLSEDPTEHNNLINQYEGTKLLEQLRAKCADHSDRLNNERKKFMDQQEALRR